MISEREAALMSYLAYDPPDPANTVDPPVGWEHVDEFDHHDDPNGSGFGARVFHNTSTGEYVVAFRGSDEEWNDWTGANKQLAFGARAPQLEQALQLIAHLQKDGVSLSKITFTGHSLGGGLASLAAVFFNRPAITFAVAPFEYSARDDFDFEDEDYDQEDEGTWTVADYYEGYRQYLLGIGGPAPDNNFGLYRDAWQYGLDGGGFQQAAAMLAARDQSMPSSSNRMRSLQFIYEVKR